MAAARLLIYLLFYADNKEITTAPRKNRQVVRMDSRKLSLGATVLVLVIIVILAVTQTSITSSATSQQPLRVAIVQGVLFSLPSMIAVEKGYFSQEGLTAEVTEFSSTKDAFDALAAGRADITVLGLPNLFAAELASPGKVKASGIMADTKERYMTYILVAKDSPVNKTSDLKGRKFGAALGTNTKVWSAAMLRSLAGLELGKDVELAQMSYGLLLGALEAGSVDAIYANEPLATIGVARGIARVLEKNPRTAVMNPAPFGAPFGVSAEFVKKRRGDACGAYRAVARAVNFLNANETAAKRVYAARERLDAATIESATLMNVSLGAGDDAQQAQRLADFMLAQGELKAPVRTQGMFIAEKELCG